MNPLLRLEGLRTEFTTERGTVQAVRGVDLSVAKGAVLGIVGESGSGKSVAVMSLLRLLKSNGRVSDGQAQFQGRDLLALREAELAEIRGRDIAVVFQDPMSSLNPTMSVGNQIIEGLLRHTDLNRTEARRRAIEMLRLVRVPSPETRIDAYPHEFSGGMRQRAMIAIALACDPALLIADEPTTALDVTVQRQILALLKDLQVRLGMSVILITHDLGVIAETADHVAVMYGGMVMEEAPVAALFETPAHPYTRGLMAAIPDPRYPDAPLQAIPGSPPDMRAPPPGCPFAPRCPEARMICATQVPPMFDAGPGHCTRCWLASPDNPEGRT